MKARQRNSLARPRARLVGAEDEVDPLECSAISLIEYSLRKGE